MTVVHSDVSEEGHEHHHNNLPDANFVVSSTAVNPTLTIREVGSDASTRRSDAVERGTGWIEPALRAPRLACYRYTTAPRVLHGAGGS